MRLLIIGGTVFLGRALAEQALARGDEVTLFHRGKHNPELFPEAERILGDRDGGLDALSGRRWDAVVDTCGYFPRVVRASATFLADAVEHYTFISSLSVFKDLREANQDETAEVGTLEDPAVEEITGETYGPLKALCEQAAEEAMPGRTLSVRAGLIVGPHDQSDRFTYWPHRVAEGGEVLAPGDPDMGVQFIDVRDLAAWILHAADQRLTRPHNVTGRAGATTMQDVLETSRQVSGSDAQLTWVSESFLLEKKVEPWMEMPLWIPGEEATAFATTNCSRALGAGLTFRPLAETVRDSLDWDRTRPAGHEWKAGITRERESELLRLWHTARA